MSQRLGAVALLVHDYAGAVQWFTDKLRESPRHEAYGTVAVFGDLYGNGWDLIQKNV